MARLAVAYAAALVCFVVVVDAGWLRSWGEFVNDHPPLDKLIHFLMYGVLAFLVNAALVRGSRWPIPRAVTIGSIVILVLSTIEECSNVLVIARHCSLGDLAANYLGIWCLGVIPFVSLQPKQAAE